MRTLQKFKLGTFEVTQPELIISDPCYAPGTWCMGIVPNAQPGIWEAEIGFFHEGKHDAAVAYLAAFHQPCPPKNQLIAREELFKVGVDSGQAGVFDKPFYRAGADAGQIPSEDALEAWYNSCCNQTLHTDHYAGVIPHGVVSNSGYGDGGYICYSYHLSKTQGEDITWGVMINFDVVRLPQINRLLLQ